MMNDSPWSKIPVLSPEDQIEYDKMRNIAELQERIDVMGEGYPPYGKKPKYDVENHIMQVDNPDDMLDLLTQLLEGSK